jgi:hypothetical protein
MYCTNAQPVLYTAASIVIIIIIIVIAASHSVIALVYVCTACNTYPMRSTLAAVAVVVFIYRSLFFLKLIIQ